MIGQVEHILYQSPTFRRKLDAAAAIVGEALKHAKRPYVAFSGGKDSLATMAVVHLIRPDVPLAWSDDELEYPETVDYMQVIADLAGPQLRITAGWTEHAGWFRPWRDRPFWRGPLPGTLSIAQPQDDWMALQGYDLTFTGLRMDENRRRRDWLAQVGPLYHVKDGTQTRCCPIWDWTADDVWALIVGMKLPYNAAYDRYEEIYVPRQQQRVGPLPLAPRRYLAEGWPDTLARLEARYGRTWPE